MFGIWSFFNLWPSFSLNNFCQHQRQSVISSDTRLTTDCQESHFNFHHHVFVLSPFSLGGGGECHLTCLWHTDIVILSVKHTSWGNSRIFVAELQLPWVKNIQLSGYVVGLIGCWACSEGTVWSWTLHEASVLSRASCAPWEEGAAAFHTLPHIHCVCACVLYCMRVFFTAVFVAQQCGFHTFLSNCFRSHSLHFVSLCFIEMNVSQLGWFIQSVRLLSPDISWVVLVFII